MPTFFFFGIKKSWLRTKETKNCSIAKVDEKTYHSRPLIDSREGWHPQAPGAVYKSVIVVDIALPVLAFERKTFFYFLLALSLDSVNIWSTKKNSDLGSIFFFEHGIMPWEKQSVRISDSPATPHLLLLV